MKALTVLLFLCLCVAGCSLHPARDIILHMSENQARMRLAVIKQDWPAFESALDGFQQRYEDLIGPSQTLNRLLELVRQRWKPVFQSEQAQDAETLDTEITKLRPEAEALTQLLAIEILKAQISANTRAELLELLSRTRVSVWRGSPPQDQMRQWQVDQDAKLNMRCSMRGRVPNWSTGGCL